MIAGTGFSGGHTGTGKYFADILRKSPFGAIIRPAMPVLIPEMESPFTPGVPVDPRLFVGREGQIQELLDAAQKAKRGNFQIAYVSGERGIGKSSLVKMALHVAATQRNAITAHAHLGGVSDFAGLGRRAMEAAAQDGIVRPWGENLMKALGNRVEKVGMMGVDITLKTSERNLASTGENLPREMAELANKIGGNRSPMILALDDINGFADTPKFAHWVKSATEIAAGRVGNVPVFLILVGLEERRRQMIKHNPSVARVFQPTLFVEPWTGEETTDFFRRGFEAGGIPPNKLNYWIPNCVLYSGGFPMLAQEIGHAVWTRARKGEDVFSGIGHAANVIGQKHLQSGVLDALRSPIYKSIFAKTANVLGKFSRRDLLRSEKLTEKEKAGVDAFLRRMRKLGAIVPDEESAVPGTYRFPTMLHALYFAIVAMEEAIKKRRAK